MDFILKKVLSNSEIEEVISDIFIIDDHKISEVDFADDHHKITFCTWKATGDFQMFLRLNVDAKTFTEEIDYLKIAEKLIIKGAGKVAFDDGGVHPDKFRLLSNDWITREVFIREFNDQEYIIEKIN